MTTDTPIKTCPNCAKAVEGRGRGVAKKFCTPECKLAFGNRTKGEGAILVPLLKVWMKHRHAKDGTRAHTVRKAAQREVTAIVRELLERDAAAGRPDLMDYVEEMLEQSLYMDRTRK